MSQKPGRPDLGCRGEAPDVLSCHISSVAASSPSGPAGEGVGVDLHLSGVVFLLGAGPGCGTETGRVAGLIQGRLRAVGKRGLTQMPGKEAVWSVNPLPIPGLVQA